MVQQNQYVNVATAFEDTPRHATGPYLDFADLKNNFRKILPGVQYPYQWQATKHAVLPTT
jgi:hypothetical protein